MSQTQWSPPELSQPEHGYRYTTDSWLLVSYAAAFQPRRWCDMGTGCGVIAYGLARRLNHSTGVAVERRRDLARFARQNLAELPVTLIEGDLRFFPWRPRQFDLLVCNPPYFETGTGRLSKVRARAEARHTLHGGIGEFARDMRHALRRDGRLCFIFPTDRLQLALDEMTDSGWHAVDRLDILSYKDRDPVLSCMCMMPRPAGQMTRNRLVLYEAHRRFTPRAVSFLGRF
ncbi:MAG: methyltransferase [Acidobacteriota bacterium]|nr:methyltransferase [Acidobacteriota bacterium]